MSLGLERILEFSSGAASVASPDLDNKFYLLNIQSISSPTEAANH